MYDASVLVLDRNGKPVSGGYVNVFNSTDGHYNQILLDDQGRGTARINAGCTWRTASYRQATR